MPAPGFCFVNVFELHACAMATAQNLTGACPVFTWNGDDWQMMPNTSTLKKDLDIGGYSLDSDLSFHCLLAQFVEDFTDVETLKQSMLETAMVYLGHNYKIVSVGILAGGLILKISANDLAQSA